MRRVIVPLGTMVSAACALVALGWLAHAQDDGAITLTPIPIAVPATATVPPSDGNLVAPVEPIVRIEVVYGWTNPESRVFRLVAMLTNQTDATVDGMVTQWNAYDETGALVGSHMLTQPRIPARMAYPYVAGAGGLTLSGAPATARVNVVNPGRVVEMPGDFLDVDSVQFERSSASPRRGITDYTVRARVTTGSESVPKSRLVTNFVLWDASGAVVGADFTSLYMSLPDVIPPNTAVRIEERVAVPTGTPVRAGVYAYRQRT